MFFDFIDKYKIMLVLVLLTSFFINTYNISAPIFYHPDENKKIHFLLSGMQDFHHPILMLQVVRFSNKFFRFEDPSQLIILARLTSAFFGMLTVYAIYLIARKTLGINYALITAIGVAVSPIMVVHAHYYKEDMIFTCFAMFSLLTLIRFIENPCGKTMLCLSITSGLALASHYKGVILILIYFITPLIVPSTRRIAYYKRITLILPITLIVFLLVNFPLFLDVEVFKSGVYDQITHLNRGHKLKIYPIQHLFSFHLINSVIPGMTFPLAMLAIISMMFMIATWKKTIWQDRIIIAYIISYYLVMETTPLKPYPGFMRYILQIIPALIYLAYRGVNILQGYLPSGKSKIITLCIICITLIFPAYDSIGLTYHMEDDTRKMAYEWMQENNLFKEKIKYTTHTFNRELIESDILNYKEKFSVKGLRAEGYSYFVISSFIYERIEYGSRLPDQNQKIYESQERYNRLFEQPYVEFQPRFKTFAFSNPTIRIVDLKDTKKRFINETRII